MFVFHSSLQPAEALLFMFSVWPVVVFSSSHDTVSYLRCQVCIALGNILGRVRGLHVTFCPAGLMMTRNKLAAYKEQGGAWDLPRPIQSEHRCKHCFSLSLCAVVHRSLEGGTAESFGLDVFDSLTAHIDEKDATFLKTWLELLEIERAEAKKKHPQENIWALDPPPHTRPVQLAPVAPVQGGAGYAASRTQPEKRDSADDCENACPNSQAPSVPAAEGASESPQRKQAEAPHPDPLSAPICPSVLIIPEVEAQHADASTQPTRMIPPAPLSAPTLQDASNSGTMLAKHALQGRCIGHLQLQSYIGQVDDSSLYPHKYTFTQSHAGSCSPAAGAPGGPALLGSMGVACSSHPVETIPLSVQGFSAGDCGILGLQGRHVAVNRAQVESVSESVLTVRLRSRLSLGFEQGCTSQASACAGGTVKESQCCSAQATDTSTPPASNQSGNTCLWRIDKDEPETAFQIAVSGVLELVVSMSMHTTRLRRLLVHFERPMKEARANYNAEVPPDVDHVEAMVESECAPLHSKFLLPVIWIAVLGPAPASLLWLICNGCHPRHPQSMQEAANSSADDACGSRAWCTAPAVPSAVLQRTCHCWAPPHGSLCQFHTKHIATATVPTWHAHSCALWARWGMRRTSSPEFRSRAVAAVGLYEACHDAAPYQWQCRRHEPHDAALPFQHCCIAVPRRHETQCASAYPASTGGAAIWHTGMAGTP